MLLCYAMTSVERHGDTIAVMLIVKLALLVSTLQQVIPLPSAAPSAPTFHDDALALGYSLPEGIVSQPETAAGSSAKLLALRGVSKTGQPCVALPLVGQDDSRLRLIYLFLRTGECTDVTDVARIGAVAAASLRGSLHTFGEPVLSSPLAYTETRLQTKALAALPPTFEGEAPAPLIPDDLLQR